MADQNNDDDPTANLQRLAKEYVDLWEQQVKAVAGDDGFADAMSKTFELMNAGAASMTAMASGNLTQQQGSRHDPRDHAEHGADAQPDANSSAAPPGATPCYSDDDIHRLLERIAELEQRVEELEK